MRLGHPVCRSVPWHERTVETMKHGGRKERIGVVVCERSRLGALWLAEAYEQVVPIVRRARTPVPDAGDGRARKQHSMAGSRP